MYEAYKNEAGIIYLKSPKGRWYYYDNFAEDMRPFFAEVDPVEMNMKPLSADEFEMEYFLRRL